MRLLVTQSRRKRPSSPAPSPALRSIRLGLVGLALAQLACAARPDDADLPDRPFEPTSHYETRQLEGWTVRISRGFLDREPKLAAQTLDLLAQRLRDVASSVPAGPLQRLQTVTIWVEETSRNPAMTYHPSAQWLEQHGLNPDKARSVELANARNVLAWSRDQPSMVLHELSHAYHDQFIEGGFHNLEIQAAFDQAQKTRLYDAVKRVSGKTDRAYAATNAREYFAESTEAFFGTNDFYPFRRDELRQHDPVMFHLLERLWEAPDSGP